jgi:hypothetical protein
MLKIKGYDPKAQSKKKPMKFVPDSSMRSMRNWQIGLLHPGLLQRLPTAMGHSTRARSPEHRIYKDSYEEVQLSASLMISPKYWPDI